MSITTKAVAIPVANDPLQHIAKLLGAARVKFVFDRKDLYELRLDIDR